MRRQRHQAILEQVSDGQVWRVKGSELTGSLRAFRYQLQYWGRKRGLHFRTLKTEGDIVVQAVRVQIEDTP